MSTIIVQKKLDGDGFYFHHEAEDRLFQRIVAGFVPPAERPGVRASCCRRCSWHQRVRGPPAVPLRCARLRKGQSARPDARSCAALPPAYDAFVDECQKNGFNPGLTEEQFAFAWSGIDAFIDVFTFLDQRTGQYLLGSNFTNA